VRRRSHLAREREFDENVGSPTPKGRVVQPRLPDPAVVTDRSLMGRLPEAQLQRVAESIQGSVGNQETAALLAGVQREKAGSTEQKQVTVLQARVVLKPSFIARTVAILSRGDTVTLTGERQGDWYHVMTSDGQAGWLHKTAWSSAPPPKVTSAPGVGWGPPPEEIEIGGRG
jgi:hypothetical protein